IVESLHEQAPHHVADEHSAPIGRREQPGAAAGRTGREIDRPEQAGMPIDESDGLALIPDVVAGADDVDAAGIEFVADLLGDAEAGGGVLSVHDDEIEHEFAPQPRHMLEHHVPPGPPDDVAAEEQTHETNRSEWLRARSRSSRAADRFRRPVLPALPALQTSRRRPAPRVRAVWRWCD